MSDQQLDQLCEAAMMWEGRLEAPADFPGTLTEALAPIVAAIRSDAWEQGMTAAKLAAVGIKPARNPYLKEG